MKNNKNLYIIRHSKSSWKHNLSDEKRPLKQRGVNDAYLVSNYLKTKLLNPDLILCSDAVRTQNTAQIFIKNLNLNPDFFKLKNELYDFSGSSFLNVVKSCDNSIDKLMVFGHNYAITNFVNTYGDLHIENVPTTGFIEIEFETDSWEDLKKGRTIQTIFPKDLK